MARADEARDARSSSRPSPTSSRICRSLMLPGDVGGSSPQPAGRARVLAGRVAHRVDDVHPAARLLTTRRSQAEPRRLKSGVKSGFAPPYLPLRPYGHPASLGVSERWCCSGRRQPDREEPPLIFPKDPLRRPSRDAWLLEDAPLSARDATGNGGSGSAIIREVASNT